MNKNTESAAILTDEQILQISAEQDYGDEDPKCIIRLARAFESALRAALAAVPEHVAYAENGVLHWMTGRKFESCELYTKPSPVSAAPVVPEGDSFKPVDLILHCPSCGLQHIDAPDDRTTGWVNPPHRSHLCHGCGHIWRPADVPTNGVEAVKTNGKADSPPAPVVLVDRNAVSRGSAIGLTELRDLFADAVLLRKSVTLSPESAGTLLLAMTTGQASVPQLAVPQGATHEQIASYIDRPGFALDNLEADEQRNLLASISELMAIARGSAVQDAPSDEQPKQTLPVCHSALRAEPAGQHDATARLLLAATAVVREALDNVFVHPCDANDDAIRAKGLYGVMAELHAALSEAQVPAGTAGCPSPTDAQVAAPVSGEAVQPDLVKLLKEARKHIMDWWRPEGELPPAKSWEFVERLDAAIAALPSTDQTTGEKQ